MNDELLFRNIYEHIEAPIFVVNVVVAGDFVFGGFNPACEQATGLRKEDVLGKRLDLQKPFSMKDLATDSPQDLRVLIQ